MSPAERLRAAATRLREVAGDATPGPWDHVVGASEDHAWVERRHTETVVTTRDIGTSAYIAMMHPPVALALADWLDDEAGFIDAIKAHADGDPSVLAPHALAVADAVLGSEQR